MFFDPLYLILMLPAMLFALFAQARTKSAYAKFSKVQARCGLTGAQAARRILDREGLRDVEIEKIPGELTDHYDPREKVLRLSTGVHDGRSLASLGVACHEMGHAFQDADAYQPLVFRQALHPTAAFASSAWIWLFMAAVFLPALGPKLMLGAMVLLAIYVAFALITLPVEFNASTRAKIALEHGGLLEADELTGASKVLNAAAMTYVASAAQAAMMLLYVVLRSRD